ncbi:MAG: PAS domain S-box protein [Burkholderiales bacterium]|nr:PAS domain S-box protein [Burkholderiales bacterium]
MYSPFRSADMMNSVLENNYPDVALEVFDGKNTSGAHRMFASHSQFQTDNASMQVQRQIEFCGRTWTLRFATLPTFEVAVDARHSASVLVVGIVLTLLITLIVTNLASTRNRAFGMAKSMNRQLTRSESQLRTVLDSAADGILSVNPRGLVQSANQAAEHTFGTPPGMLEGKPLEYSIAGLNQARLVEVLGAHGSESSTLHKARFEAIGLRASGEQFPLAVSLSEFWLDGEIHFSLMVRDISDEKMAEAILQLRLQAIEAANNGIIISDMSLPGQPIIYANPAFTRITGYREDEVVGQNCKFLQGDEAQQPEIAKLAAAIHAGEACQVLLRNYKKDGALFWNDLAIAPVRNSQGKVTHYVGSQTDITDRVRAEENLLIRTKRLDAIFTLSPDGLVAFDAHGMLTNVNPAFLRMTGLEFAQLQGCSEQQFDHYMSALCDPAQAYPSLLEACQRAASSPPLAKQMLYLTTPAKCILLRSLRVDEAGSQEKVIYFRDITHEFEVDRIKSEFLSTAAHELRTPMASIYGFSELLLRRKYDEGTQRELFGTINRQAGILINLINELLDLARIEARAGKDFKYKTQSLAPVIASAVNALLVNHDTRQVQLDIPDDLPAVHIDAEKFSLALTNVLANAYKYSPAGGDIKLKVVSRHQDGMCQLGVSVSDHGIGLSPEHLARLFERFFRADPSGNIPGTGLGMCLVKEIIELHNGSVQVESEVGQGTTVVLWLPAAVQAMPLAA